MFPLFLSSAMSSNHCPVSISFHQPDHFSFCLPAHTYTISPSRLHTDSGASASHLIIFHLLHLSLSLALSLSPLMCASALHLSLTCRNVCRTRPSAALLDWNVGKITLWASGHSCLYKSCIDSHSATWAVSSGQISGQLEGSSTILWSINLF